MLREDRQARSHSVRPVGECFQSRPDRGIRAPRSRRTGACHRRHERAAAIVDNARLCDPPPDSPRSTRPRRMMLSHPGAFTFHSQALLPHSLPRTHSRSGHSTRLDRRGSRSKRDLARNTRRRSWSRNSARRSCRTEPAFWTRSGSSSAAYLGSWINKLETIPS
jgi:hypothetical protein